MKSSPTELSPKQGLENLRAYQGDSHKQNELTSQKFDLIFGCNLIDRLQYPRQWLLQSKVKEIDNSSLENIVFNRSAGNADCQWDPCCCFSLHLATRVHTS